ncbi:uncharacterized protein LOC143914659 [Arctopsyche grandis]|uniref:uncharacterized protein LOC143914659 n=1 Tax=Arctopsyche grandis TaxID=121162 RepID=UPI00406D70D9
MISRIEAFEMWVYRRMLKIPWTKKISNEAVLGMMGRGRELVSVIKRRNMEYLGHMIRGPKYEFLRLMTMGKIEGKKWIGRKKLSWLRNMRMWTDMSAEELFRAAEDRCGYIQIIDEVVANVRMRTRH